jgi:2-succinyl-5-enolpyruvyl-6-hydroxy-3-cyclohexene-1-carboxylate synthase
MIQLGKISFPKKITQLQIPEIELDVIELHNEDVETDIEREKIIGKAPKHGKKINKKIEREWVDKIKQYEKDLARELEKKKKK